MKVSVNYHKSVGKWVVSRGKGKSRKRASFETKAKAQAEAAGWREQIRSGGVVWDDLTDDERKRLIQVWQDSKKRGVDIAVALNAPAAPQRKTVGDVVSEIETAKTNAGRAGRYINGLLCVLNQFAKGRTAMFIDQITFTDVEVFLDSKSLAYRSTLRARLSTLFNFAVRRGYLLSNPCLRVEAVTYHKPAPQIFTTDQIKSLMAWFMKNPNGLTWFIQTTFCGLRPEEAQNTPREKIQCIAGHIIVDVQTTKVRERRVVTPMPEAMKWLRRSLKYGGKTPLSAQAKRRLLRKLRKIAEFKRWPKDITRHTAASLWLALKPDAAYVAEQLGNSEKVLKRDYKALLTPAQAREYFAVLDGCLTRDG